MAGRIFISYRRDDVRADARDLAGRLSRAFGARNVFMDVDHLLVGQRFDKELEAALAQCDIFIAVIGNKWTETLAERRASGERDFVVDEIAAAIERGISVIPVLVDGAPLPHQDTLPPSISALPFYQTHDLKHESFGRDAEALIASIKAVRAKTQREVGGRGLPWGRLAAGFALVAIVTVGALLGPKAVSWWPVGQDSAALVKAEKERQAALLERQRQEAARKVEAVRKAADDRRAAEARMNREAEAREAAAAAKAKRELAEHKAREAQERDDKAWTKAVDANTLRAVKVYMRNFPDGRHSSAANGLLAMLEAAEAHTRKAEKRSAEGPILISPRSNAQVIKQRVALRTKPGTLSKSLRRLDVGEIVSLIEEVKDRYWWKVKARDGQIGYVKKDEVRALAH